MIVFKDKSFIANSAYPDSDWTGTADFVVLDNTELAEKIIGLYPYYDFVLDASGNLTDVSETVRPEPDKPVPAPPSNEELLEYMIDLDFRVTRSELGI